MKHPRWSLLTALFLSVSQLASGESRVVFLPVVSVLTDTRSLPDGTLEFRSWRSSVHIRNFGTSASSYRTLPFFAGPCSQGPVVVEPDRSRPLCDVFPRGGVDFVAIELSEGLAVSAEMKRLVERLLCRPQSSDADTVTLGRVPLPVFDEMVPAGSLATTNHIELGAVDLSSRCSSLPQDLHRRRVNLALANGGTEAATFVVRLHSLLSGQFDQRVFEVGPRAVAQFNGIQPPFVPFDGVEDDSEAFWLSVSSDQPFVGYASSIFEGGGPEAMPLEVFPLRRLH